MADNTFNFDLDAPAVPTLTLDLPHRSSRR